MVPLPQVCVMYLLMVKLSPATLTTCVLETDIHVFTGMLGDENGKMLIRLFLRLMVCLFLNTMKFLIMMSLVLSQNHTAKLLNHFYCVFY